MSQSGNDTEYKGLTMLMITMIQSRGVGSMVVEAAAELIAENARFNRWAFRRKARSTTVEMWNMAALASRLCADCSSAWSEYNSSTHNEGRREELIDTLMAASNALCAAREGDSAPDDPAMPDEIREFQ